MNFTRLAHKQFKSSFLLMSYEGAVQTVGFLSMTLFLFVGAQQVMSGEMTIGAMVAFNSLVAMANAPILTLLSMWDNWQLAAVLLNRMNDIFESEPEQGHDHSHLKPVRYARRPRAIAKSQLSVRRSRFTEDSGRHLD